MPLGAGRVIGDPFDGLTSPEQAPDLELEAVVPAAPPRTSGTRKRPHLDIDAIDAPPEPPPAAASSTRAARVRDRLTDPSVRAEVLALADYGDPPASFVGVVPYAVLVLTRQHAMRQERRSLNLLLARARADAEDAETLLGRAVHARKGAPELEGLAAQLEEADRLGAAAGEHTGKFEVARQAAETQRLALEQKLGELEQRAGPYRDRETQLATQMEVRQTDLRRAQAKHHRVGIELRNLRANANSDPAQIQLLEADSAARMAEAQTAQDHVDELTPKLSEARRELAVILSAQNDLRTQQRAVEQAQSRSEKTHQSAASQVEREYERAVRALANAALERGVARSLAPEPTQQVELMRSAHRTRERELELYEAAFEAHDRSALIKGLSVLGVAGLVVLTMILLVLIR